MEPRTFVEVMVVAFIVSCLLICALALPQWRRRFVYVSLAVIILYAVLFIGRPFWIDYRIANKVEQVELYLLDVHPDDSWQIATVPHRVPGFKHMNPYIISVTLETDPDVVYYYAVEQGEVIEAGFSSIMN
ncbi:hypothetical protein FLK61_32740 [Paenalkalicoccus suaedae]|uniref:Uncharacterized protein n=1 Tax=Paenalkalicoccus suaedae TaxID=2592382 RepID=A0A859FF68_9BACI|nr:hypothetical protein [Paenalkalicoccus suaedae]QKS71468.1 hypothetical protein FLK61_32740 [Paenalkalicoccus suaedae]